MSWNGPEEKSKSSDKGGCYHRHPYRTADEQLVYVGLFDGERAERGSFGLAEEDKDGVKFVLGGGDEEDGNCVGDEELCEK